MPLKERLTQANGPQKALNRLGCQKDQAESKI